jgi:hypothetical protein
MGLILVGVVLTLALEAFLGWKLWERGYRFGKPAATQPVVVIHQNMAGAGAHSGEPSATSGSSSWN